MSSAQNHSKKQRPFEMFIGDRYQRNSINSQKIPIALIDLVCMPDDVVVG